LLNPLSDGSEEEHNVCQKLTCIFFEILRDRRQISSELFLTKLTGP